VILQDIIGSGDSAHGQLRFINLSPNAPPLDMYAFSYTTNDGYKLIFSNCGYLPTDFAAAASAQTFKTLPTGPYDLIAVESGTDTAVSEGGLIVNPNSVTTIYTRGFMNGTGSNALAVGIFSFQQ
jgi:hypothetical protein